MNRKILTGQGCGHFVTFSTYGRRNLLASPRARQVVIGQLGKLAAQGTTGVSGFVIMPDHVHALLWFEDDAKLPQTMQTWKSASAHWLKVLYREISPAILTEITVTRNGRKTVSFWQRHYYDFNVASEDKAREKLEYMHHNPVKKGLCARPEDWIWGSARWYVLHRSVGVNIEPGF
jgi:putative transposase